MKKSAPFIILFVLALLIWNAMFDPVHMDFMIGDEDFDGPLGALAALLMAGGGILIGFVVMVFVAIVLAVVFAGVGIVVVAALVLAAIVAAIAISPLLLPLLIPIGIIWYLSSRNRKRERNHLKEGAV